MTQTIAPPVSAPTDTGISRPLRVVGVSGSLHEPSKTTALVNAILAEVADTLDAETRLVSLVDIGPRLSGALTREALPADVEEELLAIEGADLLVVASPVYRGTYSGLFKHLFDLVHHEALIDVPVLLAATGGSDRHALVIDHQFRPLFAFFQARVAPIGVYASEQDFTRYEVTSQALKDRIALAVAKTVPLLRLPRAELEAVARAA